MNNWYVITGGPCAGKTTLVNVLRDDGYTVVFETARIYIEQELQKGRTLQEIRKDVLQFQHKIIDLSIEVEKNLDSQDTVFLDRGIPDGLAFLDLHTITPDEKMLSAARTCSYKKVFLLELLDYSTDYARLETPEEAKKIEELLRKTYTNLGMEIVYVPKMTISERINFILKNL